MSDPVDRIVRWMIGAHTSAAGRWRSDHRMPRCLGTSKERWWIRWCLIPLVVMATILPPRLAFGHSITWKQQFAASGVDAATQAHAVSVASSGIYVAGFTEGVFPGETASGGATDAFVRKYDGAGATAWTKQFGGGPIENGAGFTVAYATSAVADSVYVAGYTQGVLPGQVSAGGWDAFVAKYAPSGDLLWTRQFGVAEVEADEIAYGVSATSDAVYVVGSVSTTSYSSDGFSDAFIRKYDNSGTVLWTNRFTSQPPGCLPGECMDTGEDLRAVSVGSDGVYVAGSTGGSLPGESYAGQGDAFVRKYDPSGDVAWTRQFGTTASEYALGVSVAGADVYVGGATNGSFPGQQWAGASDAFVRRYGADGTASWTRQFGAEMNDEVKGVFATSTSVYLAGEGEFIPGQAGEDVGFVRKYDPSGSVVWTRGFGGSGRPRSISAPSEGIYVAGRDGSAFVARISSSRPDGHISRSSSSGYVGNGVYNTTGTGQTRSADARRGATQAFYIRTQNDGHQSTRLVIDGCGSSSGFGVKYLTGSTNVTTSVVAGTYRPLVAPGGWKTLKLIVTIKSSARIGQQLVCSVRIGSTIADVVKAKVTTVHG